MYKDCELSSHLVLNHHHLIKQSIQHLLSISTALSIYPPRYPPTHQSNQPLNPTNKSKQSTSHDKAPSTRDTKTLTINPHSNQCLSARATAPTPATLGRPARAARTTALAASAPRRSGRSAGGATAGGSSTATSRARSRRRAPSRHAPRTTGKTTRAR